MSGLENKIIISTRPLSADDSIKRNLIEKGARVLDFPMIEISPIKLSEGTREVLQQIATFQWIVFTSKNGVDCFFKLLNQLSINTDAVAQLKIAVVGKKTLEEVVKNKCTPYLLSKGTTSSDLLNDMVEKAVPTDRILLVQGELADDTLELGLENVVFPTRLNVYQTLYPRMHSKELIQCIRRNEYDIILFTSPSGFEQFKKIMPETILAADFRSACIGRTTEKAMVNSNCRPLFVSRRSEGESFVTELEIYFNN